ncbi:MAG: type II toxin-antitoxin system HipA family toxin YjjJ [Pseudomonadota bacterium]
MASIRDLLSFLAGREPVASLEIQHALGVSQATASRLITQAGEQVLRLGRGRTTRYAAVLDLHGAGMAVPLFSVDRRGVATELGELRRLGGGQYLLEGQDLPSWLLGHEGTGLYPSLPYFLDELRPSGFVGRLKARALSAEWDFPQDPRTWAEQHVVQYLVRRGHDEPGNLILGRAAVDVAQRSDGTAVTDRELEYPLLAGKVLGDQLVGSSAAGEQPKFLVWLKDTGHVIVKFSPAGSGDEARRWRDLLRAEALAQHALQVQGIPAATATIHEHEGRVFLESPRFDRQGKRGRLPSLSLASVDAEFAGVGLGWSRTAAAIHQRGLLDEASLDQISWAELFGTWTGNSDMHLGNVSLRPAAEGFTLAPLYDMLPMSLAPNRGELPSPSFTPPLRPARRSEQWDATGKAAEGYWRELADDASLDQSLRRQAEMRAERISQLLG